MKAARNGGSHVRRESAVRMSGGKAVGYSWAGGGRTRYASYAIVHGDKLYVITLSAAESTDPVTSQKGLVRESGVVLKSWKRG